MRKILAVLCTILTVFAIKETVYLFLSKDADIIAQKTQLQITALSITIPLIILSLWLWSPKKKED
ncbi:hypothetical protein EZJ43_07235 [Pedobacter changchengzhani]|uniref:Uncharacterized protein n=1 Tax=Pedobacter changchengzhani TaxID=2529274 RepID=A0A4V3A057_9SPHI|nr:hypothetical protein [Pedobacter changchengzhani]TDG36313.1 hypothetical protein EZJ43_07235 [Pedobacter changchengzhani]